MRRAITAAAAIMAAGGQTAAAASVDRPSAPAAVSMARATAVYDMPAQDLAAALNNWARQSGRQILFPYQATVGRRSPPLSGRMTHDAALARLLEGQAMEIAGEAGGVISLRVVERRAEADAPPPRALETVVVTAQRRSEDRQDVPVAVTAFDARQVDAFRLKTLQDVSRLTPGLLVSSFSPARPIIAIRGATNTFSQIGVDKPAGVFVDDVYIPRTSASTIELFDVAGIEVLKGPQGTLFGRNVTGGAIVIDTGRPAFEDRGGVARLSVGDFATVDADFRIDAPIGETVAVRAAGLVRRTDGWGRDRLTGRSLDDVDSRASRAQLRWRASESVEVLFGLDASWDASGGRTLSSIGAGDDGDRRTAELGVPQRFSRAQAGVSARIFWDTPWGQVTSVSAWRGSRSTDVFSNVGTNFRFLTGTQSQALSDDRDRVSTASQEVRLATDATRRVSAVVGVYAATEDAERLLRTLALGAVSGRLVQDQTADQAVESDTVAVFADVKVKLTDRVALTVGGRQTWDEKTADLVRANPLAPATGFALRGLSRQWSEFTPRVVLEGRLGESALVYASYARGYTAGGFNTEAATIAALQTPFAPETLDNREIGLKSEWFDRRLRVNVSAFDMDYRDKQELFFNNVTRVLNITNAARASMKGLEAEIAARPAPWLTLTGSVGLIDSRYDAFVIPGGAVNTGNRLGSAPRRKSSFSVEARRRVGTVRIFGIASASHTSGYFTGAAADPGLFVPSYTLVDAQAGVSLPNGAWELSIYGRNLTDEDYLLIPSVQVVRSQYLGPPRRIGLSLTARF